MDFVHCMWRNKFGEFIILLECVNVVPRWHLIIKFCNWRVNFEIYFALICIIQWRTWMSIFKHQTAASNFYQISFSLWVCLECFFFINYFFHCFKTLSTNESTIQQNHNMTAEKRKKKLKKKERESCLKSLWSTELSQPSCLNQTRWWYLKTPVLQWEMVRPSLLSNFLPPLLLPPAFPPSLPPFSSLAHTQASCLSLILQIVSKACLCSISAKASPVIDQLQQNQLQAF